MLVRPIALGFAASVVLAPAAHAVQQAKSRYSTIDLAKCSSEVKAGGGKAWRCPGLPGYPIYVATLDLKTFLSVGDNAAARRAATQTLGAANSIFDGRSRRSAVEWRFIIRDKRTVPYATIVRYFTQDHGQRGEVLVVTRVSDNDTCQVARIDALATPDPLVLARRIADDKARKFDCGRAPAVEGASGKSPM